jgi:hypothetical protein
MKIPQPRRAWGGESHKELESLLYSIPRSRTWNESSRGEWFGPLGMKEMSLNNSRTQWPRGRAIGGGGVLIELSQESSHWAQIWILDNIQGSRTMFDWVGQCLAGGFYGLFVNLGLAQIGPDNIRLSWTMLSRDLLFVDDLSWLGVCSNWHFSINPSCPS